MLVSLEFPGENVKESEVADISSHLRGNSIRLLSLRGCSMKDEAFHEICRAVSASSSLQHLNLNINVVHSSHRMNELATALRVNHTITHLMLHGTSLTVKQVKKLWKALKRHPIIEFLDLGDCSLTDACVQYVARLLSKQARERSTIDSRAALVDSKPSHCMKELNLSANTEITLLGWTQLAIGLARNTTLQMLYLDYNDLLSEGAAVLSVALSVHPEIQVVDMEGCGIGDDGASHILAALTKPRPPKLEKLILTNNDISVEKVSSITTLLAPPV